MCVCVCVCVRGKVMGLYYVLAISYGTLNSEQKTTIIDTC